jgi:hypothetical protein
MAHAAKDPAFLALETGTSILVVWIDWRAEGVLGMVQRVEEKEFDEQGGTDSYWYELSIDRDAADKFLVQKVQPID